MIRRRGDTPPEPFDTHDTGRDHITGPHRKNDGLHTHSAKNNVETAAAPITVQEDRMSVTSNSTRRSTVPGWIAEHDENGRITHAMGPSIWEPGIDIYTASDPHRGAQAYDADGNVIPAGHLLGYACRLLRIHDALRTAQRQHELASRPEAQA